MNIEIIEMLEAQADKLDNIAYALRSTNAIRGREVTAIARSLMAIIRLSPQPSALPAGEQSTIGVAYGPILEWQKEYIYRGELPPAVQPSAPPEQSKYIGEVHPMGDLSTQVSLAHPSAPPAEKQGKCAFNQTGHLGLHQRTLYCDDWQPALQPSTYLADLRRDLSSEEFCYQYLLACAKDSPEALRIGVRDVRDSGRLAGLEEAAKLLLDLPYYMPVVEKVAAIRALEAQGKP